MSRIGSRAITHAVGIATMVAALSLVACSPTASTPTPSSEAGAALLEKRCSVCHTLDRVTSVQKDEAEWNTTIDRMRGNGAVVSEQEQKELVAYLLSK